jgi:hypothetical protein
VSIPTNYKGVEYRSRLEARWAAFFDLIGWQHTYEPFDGRGYIPDFLVHGNRPLLIEIKPANTMPQYQAPIAKIENGLRDRTEDILILGVDPITKLAPTAGDGDRPVPGLLGEQCGGHIEWATAHWFRCLKCQTINVFHPLMSFTGRPCGCAPFGGDDHLGHANRNFIASSWAEATNIVKWRGAA